MGWKRLIGVVVLASACDYRGAFEDYCADTGFCECEDGACCVVEQFRCDTLECCPGLWCVEGMCVVPAELAASPTFVDFGRITPDTNATARITLENVGSAPTPSAVQLDVSWGFTIDSTDCNRVLLPGQRCEVIVACRAAGLAAELGGALTAQYGRRILNVGLAAKAGVRIHVWVNGAAQITELHSGRVCGSSDPTAYRVCTWPFPFDAVVQLRHGPVTDGYSFFSGGPCSWVDGVCTFVADVEKYVMVYPSPNLQLAVWGTGRVEGVNPACVRAQADPSSGTHCAYPVSGWVTLTAVPTAPATVVEWSGACSGRGPCVLEVRGPTSVYAQFL